MHFRIPKLFLWLALNWHTNCICLSLKIWVFTHPFITYFKETLTVYTWGDHVLITWQSIKLLNNTVECQVYFNFQIFRLQPGRQKILNCMVASIPWIYSLLISSLMQFWFVTVVPKYLNFATFSKDVLAAFIFQFFITFCWLGMNIRGMNKS
jgi:hypothetical protein